MFCRSRCLARSRVRCREELAIPCGEQMATNAIPTRMVIHMVLVEWKHVGVGLESTKKPHHPKRCEYIRCYVGK